MKIEKIIGREIFDSRGYPTIECEVVLEDGVFVTSSVPTGLSRGKHEAFELRDHDSRLLGRGVSKAIENLENIIGPELLGKIPDVVSMDVQMLELDGTENKSKLGANAILAASIAVLKAQAIVQDYELYELIAHLCGLESISLPLPMFNMIEGGVHANNKLQIQEFLIVPNDMPSFRSAMEAATLVFFELKRLLENDGKDVAVGDEGGFACEFKDEIEALDYLKQAIENTKKNMTGSFVIGLDIAASQFYDAKKKKYLWHGKLKTSEQLIEYYEKLADEYSLYSIEDGLDEDDWKGWQEMTKILSKKVQVVGDDIFVTSAERIWRGIEEGVGTAVIIKPNQIGTITETLQAIKLCKDYDLDVIVSHRSGETNDTFIADLAVGTSAGHIKAGSCCRGERIAKYNQLLRIEDTLVLSLLGVQ
jgi:enolase